MSTDAHAEAIKTLLRIATKAPVYDFDEADAMAASALPASFTIVHLERRFGGEARLDGMGPGALRRLYTRVASKTVSNLRLIEDRTEEAFQFTPVNLGDTTAFFVFETGGGSFDQSEGYYVRTTSWTFAI